MTFAIPKLTITEETSKQLTLFLFVLVGHFLIRALFTAPIEPWDAFWKWHPSTAFADGSFDPKTYKTSPFHHYSRWGVTLLTAGFIKIFGNTLHTYYLVPMTISTIFFVIFFFTAKRHLTKPFLLMVVVLMFVDPYIIRYSTHLHTRFFGCLFILCSLLLIEKNSPLRLILAAGCLFYAYAAKETYGLMFGPALLFLVFVRYGFKPALLFSATCVVLIAIETLIFNYIWQYKNITWGRFELLLESRHMVDIQHYQFDDIKKYLRKYWFRTSIVYVLMMGSIYLFGLALLASKKLRSKTPSFINGLVLVVCSYAFINTFAMIRLEPLIPLQPPKFKYFTPILPFMFFLSCYLLMKVFSLVKAKWQPLCHFIFMLFAIGVLIKGMFFTTLFGLNGNYEKAYEKWAPNYFVTRATAFYWNAEESFDLMGSFLANDYAVIASAYPFYAFVTWTSQAAEDYNLALSYRAINRKHVTRFKSSLWNEEIEKCVYLQGRYAFYPIKPASCDYWLRELPNKK